MTQEDTAKAEKVERNFRIEIEHNTYFGHRSSDAKEQLCWLLKELRDRNYVARSGSRGFVASLMWDSMFLCKECGHTIELSTEVECRDCESKMHDACAQFTSGDPDNRCCTDCKTKRDEET